MKNIASIIVFGLLALACEGSSQLDAEDPGIPENEQDGPSTLIYNIDPPSLVPSSGTDEIKYAVETTLAEFEVQSANLGIQEKTITLFEQPNTQVKVWFVIDEPVKIEHGAVSNSGEMDKTFIYYLENKKLWYADQVAAKYVFDKGEMKFWLDENWEVLETRPEMMDQHEKIIKEVVDSILAKF